MIDSVSVSSSETGYMFLLSVQVDNVLDGLSPQLFENLEKNTVDILVKAEKLFAHSRLTDY